MTTNVPTSLVFSLGLDRMYGRVVRDGIRKVHRLTIDQLAPATQYQCRIRVTPAGGGKPRSKICSFTTLSEPPLRLVDTVALRQLTSATTVSEAEQALRGFLAQYGLSLSITVVLSAHPGVSFAVLDDGDLRGLTAYGELLIDEFAKYPADWIRVSGLTGVVIVKGLTVLGTRRAAMPDGVADLLYYDIAYGYEDGAREVIHHEFHHLITYNLFGSFYPSDPSWLALNAPGFQYGNGGASCYQPSNTCLTGFHPIPGFVSGYASSAMEEDKAEVYGYLLTRNFYNLVKGWIREDTLLAAKVASMRSSVCERVQRMCGVYFDEINR